MTHTMESGAFLRWVLHVVFTAAALLLTLFCSSAWLWH